MVWTRRASTQEHSEDGIARVLDFDNFGKNVELPTISETLGISTCQDSASQPEQPEICGLGESENEEEQHDWQVIFPNLCKTILEIIVLFRVCIIE